MKAVSINYVRECLRYSESCGHLFWQERPREHFKTSGSCAAWNKKYAGREAGNKWSTRGGRINYVTVSINGTNFRSHRVVWVIAYGEWPEKHIDHIDGDGTNNRLENLVAATPATNSLNLGRYKNNTSGICGVRRRKNRWHASINKGGARFFLGCFEDLFSAACSRKSAEASLGFSARHGS